MSKRSFIALDGLRGVAAIAIVTRHVSYFSSPLFESYLSVDFFFVLSGFVLSHAYRDRLRTNLSTIDFVKLRIIRLYPLYGASLVFLGIHLIGAGFLRAHGSMQEFATLIFFPALFLPTPAALPTALLFPLNGPAWSLFFELIANMAWAPFERRMGNRCIALFVIVAAVTLLITVLGKAVGFGFATNTGVMDNGFQWGSIGAGLVRVMFSFFCGVFVYRLWIMRAFPIRVSPWLLAAFLFLILAIKPPAEYQVGYDLTVSLLVFPCLVWIGASSAAQGMTAQIFALLGAASYGIYILQVPLNMIVFRATSSLFPQVQMGNLFGVMFIMLLIGVALAADKYFDRPVRNWLTLRFLQVRSPLIDESTAP